MKELMKVLSDTFIGDAYDFQNAKKHTLAKKGVSDNELTIYYKKKYSK